jgi:hypothetical protein
MEDYTTAPPRPDYPRPTARPVTSRPLPETKRKHSAIVRGATLDRMRPGFERLVGVGLLSLSFAGSVLAFNGGWGASINWLGVTAGISTQVLVTVIEWLYRHQRLSWQYGGVLLIDIGTTIVGFSPLILLPIVSLLTAIGAVEYTGIIGWGVIVLASILLAAVPERILID